ncbi:MAG: hypothetical protein ACOYXM_10700 [Actinomycetota bacterium]
MTKWRAVLVGAMAGGALAAGAFIPAQAETVVTPIGNATVDVGSGGGEVTADGAPTNPDPLDGYVTAYGDPVTQSGDICADDEGSPGDVGGNPTCASNTP